MKTCPVCDTDYPDQHSTCPTDGAVLIVSHEFAAGSLVRGKYRIVRTLGQGGMGVVYLADDILLGVRVALKFLAGELGKDPKFIKRFRMEARAAYQLRHPNIVEVTNLDQGEDGTLFIAMEFVDGPNLRVVLESARTGLAIPRALEITRGLASGLAAAHAQGTVHRDIKPENILITRTADGRERPKILDFGIVAMAENATRISRTHGLLLTPDYAAPEQWDEMPSAEMDGRTDLYALGGVLYEMLTGTTPFHAHNTSGWMKQHLNEVPKPPSQLRPELANWAGLDGLVLRLLAKDRSLRPNDAAEVLGLLETVRFVSAEERRQTVIEETLNRSQTVIEEFRAHPEPVPVPIPIPSPNPPPSPAQKPAPPAAPPPVPPAPKPLPPAPKPIPYEASEQTEEQTSKPIFSEPEPDPRRFPLWAWAVLAVMAVISAFAVIRIFTPQPQPQPQQTNQPVSQPEPSQSGSNNPQQSVNVPAPDSRPTSQKPDAVDIGIGQRANALYDKNSFAEAAPLYEQACAAKDAFACTRLGYQYNTGQGVEKDDARAAALYSKACDGGNANGCGNLGALYNTGQGVERDLTRAAALYIKACGSGENEACVSLGRIFNSPQGGTLDSLKLAPLFTKACDRGELTSCTNLGRMYQEGTGVAKNESRAATLFEKACNGKNAAGCELLGKMYDTGQGVRQDYSMAVNLYTNACNGGDADGCSQLGSLYKFGIGVDKDTEKARTLFKKACDLGNERGCTRLKDLK